MNIKKEVNERNAETIATLIEEFKEQLREQRTMTNDVLKMFGAFKNELKELKQEIILLKVNAYSNGPTVNGKGS